MATDITADQLIINKMTLEQFKALPERDPAQVYVIIDAQPTGYIPIGTILPFGGTTLPDGFLWAQGAAVSRTTYAGLFAVYGTTYGAGDGNSTFNLPNTTGAFLRGSGDAGNGHVAAALGAGQDDGIRNIKFNYAPTYYADRWPRTSWVSGAADYASTSGENTRVQSDNNNVGQGGGLLFDANLQTTGKGQQYTMPGRTTVTNAMAGHANASDIRPYNKTVNYIIKY